MPYAAVNDIRMYYEERGRGEPLVLLHGVLGALDFQQGGWHALLPAFAVRYRTLQVEYRGHGRTGNPAGRLAFGQVAADVAAFIERLDLAPAHVAGVSAGGIVALTLGMTRPDLLHSLVCVGAFFRLDDQVREEVRYFDPETIERDEPEFAADLAGWHDPHHHAGYWRELVRQARALLDGGLAYTEADLRGIPTPTLLVAGEADGLGNLDQVLAMRRSIPRAELLVLNYAGAPDNAHLVQHTRADVVGPIVLDFLGRHPGPAVAA